MSVYVIVSYDIVDPEGFAGYVPGVMPLLQKHGAEIVVADMDARGLEGERRGVYVVLRFESEDKALAWYNDPDYQPVKKIRFDSCRNSNMVITKQFVPPGS